MRLSIVYNCLQQGLPITIFKSNDLSEQMNDMKHKRIVVDDFGCTSCLLGELSHLRENMQIFGKAASRYSSYKCL